jgi:hypothetical protein
MPVSFAQDNRGASSGSGWMSMKRLGSMKRIGSSLGRSVSNLLTVTAITTEAEPNEGGEPSAAAPRSPGGEPSAAAPRSPGGELSAAAPRSPSPPRPGLKKQVYGHMGTFRNLLARNRRGSSATSRSFGRGRSGLFGLGSSFKARTSSSIEEADENDGPPRAASGSPGPRSGSPGPMLKRQSTFAKTMDTVGRRVSVLNPFHFFNSLAAAEPEPELSLPTEPAPRAPGRRRSVVRLAENHANRLESMRRSAAEADEEPAAEGGGGGSAKATPRRAPAGYTKRTYAEGGKKGGQWAAEKEEEKGVWIDGLYESNEHLRERRRLRMLPEVEKAVRQLWGLAETHHSRMTMRGYMDFHLSCYRFILTQDGQEWDDDEYIDAWEAAVEDWNGDTDESLRTYGQRSLHFDGFKNSARRERTRTRATRAPTRPPKARARTLRARTGLTRTIRSSS